MAGANYDPNSSPAVAVDGTGSTAHFGNVNAIGVNPQGDVYVSENGTAIGKINSAGVITTIADA